MTFGPFYDTSIIIDWLRDRPGAQEELAGQDHHRMSRIVWTEVLAGETPGDRSRVEALLLPFEVVEVDETIARIAVGIRHRSRLKLLDALILATAQVNDAVLVTRNTRDFPADLPGVRIPYTL